MTDAWNSFRSLIFPDAQPTVERPVSLIRKTRKIRRYPKGAVVDGEWSYCAACNRLVASAGEIIRSHSRGKDSEYGQVVNERCPGSDRVAPKDPPVGDVEKFAFRVDDERRCRDQSIHKAHRYRYRTYYWCPGSDVS